MASINYNIRMDENLKERAFPVIESYGLTPAQAIKLFLTQIADTNTVPISFDYHAKLPNLATQKILEQAKIEFGSGQRYSTVDEAIKAMQGIVDG